MDRDSSVKTPAHATSALDHAALALRHIALSPRRPAFAICCRHSGMPCDNFSQQFVNRDRHFRFENPAPEGIDYQTFQISDALS